MSLTFFIIHVLLTNKNQTPIKIKQRERTAQAFCDALHTHYRSSKIFKKNRLLEKKNKVHATPGLTSTDTCAIETVSSNVRSVQRTHQYHDTPTAPLQEPSCCCIVNEPDYRTIDPNHMSRSLEVQEMIMREWKRQ
jgi:hypothetical protein